MARVAEEWFLNDIHLLTESRRHFLADRLSDGGALVSNQQFLQSLSEMRTAFDSLPDDDGPYHVEVFPWHYAAPERELLAPGSQPEFRRTDAVDSEVEDLIMKLCCGKWP
ncbi:MAG: hypothetical protein ACK53V_17120 [Planctomycetota bacterium]